MLTRQLLAFSRHQILQPVVMDLNATVVDGDKMLSRLISEDIRLVTVLQPHLEKVKAGPTQIEQIIMNLAVNARDAMPGGGTLTIETCNADVDENYARQHAVGKPGPYVKLTVSDAGVGIDKEIQAHICEPFFTTKGVGKGYGTRIVHRLRYRQAKWRLYLGVQRAGTRDEFQGLLSAGRRGSRAT